MEKRGEGAGSTGARPRIGQGQRRVRFRLGQGRRDQPGPGRCRANPSEPGWWAGTRRGQEKGRVRERAGPSDDRPGPKPRARGSIEGSSLVGTIVLGRRWILNPTRHQIRGGEQEVVSRARNGWTGLAVQPLVCLRPSLS